MNTRGQALIDALKLEPHPEGGYYREVFRSEHTVFPTDERSERRALTAIYFLLYAGQHSRWHCVQSDEIWSHLEGEPIELYAFDAKRGRMTRDRVGRHSPGSEPVHVIPAGLWQAAVPLGEYCLVGCSVGPGFEFSDFRLASDDPTVADAIRAQGAEFARLL
ncbi:MAG TPA: cupin domain-containing protein [Anaerolineales bacterium]|nr:cupin domain-containing protein [Anaerolineales bacterium]